MPENYQSPKPSSIFFIEVDKIKPNPLQPRQEFDEGKLSELAESIRSYGVLQPLVVVRTEKSLPTGVVNEYELIAGERRLRASRLAGLREVPVLIREEPAEKVKLEMAIVENVQREDLSPLDRATAFKKLNEDFALTHKEIGMRIGKSREYVANSVRLLALPSEMQTALREGHLTEGHCRPLLMLSDRPDEQKTLFEDILYKNLTVRQAETISREIAFEKRRKQSADDPETKNLEEKLREALGTRVSIQRRGIGGKISIEFFSPEELQGLLEKFTKEKISEIKPAAERASEPAPPALPSESEAGEPSGAAASPEEVQNFTI